MLLPRTKFRGSILSGSWSLLGLPVTEFSYQSARFLVLTGLATDEILELHFARLMVFAGLAWACHRHNFGLPVCDSSGLCWACLCHGWIVLLVLELSCAQGVRFAGCAGRIELLWFVSYVLCHLSPEVR